jgi:hypothetical protein
MPPAIIPTNKNRPRIHVVWGIKTIVRNNNLNDHDNGNNNGNSKTVSIDDSKDSRDGTVVYNTNFELNSLDCQQHIFKMCRAIALRKDLVQPNSESCIFDRFAIWLKRNYQLSFPYVTTTRGEKSLEYLLYEFITEDTIGKNFKSYVLFNSIPTGKRNDRSKVIAIVSMFYSIERSFIGGFPAMSAYSKWDELIHYVNEEAPANAGDAYHTSELWTRAITEVVAVLGTLSGIGFVLVTTFLAIWLFTASVKAAFICTCVLLCVLSTTTGLFWLYGWELGIVEAVGVSILLGACVDYPAHVIERFVDIDENNDDDHSGNLYLIRKARVTTSITSVGVSVLNASATTVCSCSILIFCTVQVFNRIGVIMLTASAVSMTATIVMVPAILSLYGPRTFVRSMRYRMKVSFVVICIGLVTFFVVYMINVSLGRPLF